MTLNYPRFHKQFRTEKGKLFLQHCSECSTLQYPPREVCRTCLCDTLEWKTVSAQGKLVSWTVLHTGLEPAFENRFPWKIGEVKLECGVQLIVHLDIEEPFFFMEVSVELRLFEETLMYFASKHQKE